MEETKFKRPEYHLNQCAFVGRLSKDAEQAQTQTGKPYAWVELWVNTEEPRKPGEPPRVKEQFIRAQYWRAEGWCQYAKRNRLVWVTGRMEGYRVNGRIEMQLNIDRIQFLDSPGTMNGTGPADTDLTDELEKLQAHTGQVEDFNRELKAKLHDLSTANDEWERQYRALHAAHEQLKAEQLAVNPSLPGRKPTKIPSTGKSGVKTR